MKTKKPHHVSDEAIIYFFFFLPAAAKAAAPFFPYFFRAISPTIAPAYAAYLPPSISLFFNFAAPIYVLCLS